MKIGDVEYESHARVATIRLNRPDKYNAISARMPADLVAAVAKLVDRIKAVPKNQLAMMKMLVNQAYDSMGLNHTQTLATLFDGFARHNPEGLAFKARAEDAGFKKAVAERDSGAPIPGSKQ